MTIKTKPICKTVAPELYTRHTAHMKKAKALTYNYAVIDDYIVEHYGKKTLRQIADDLNEYYNRILYRWQVLEAKGLILSPRKRRRLERQVEAMEQQMVMTYLEAQKIKAKLAKLEEVGA